jgi:hypothetical protein
MLMQVDARHEGHEAVVGGRRRAEYVMLVARKRTVSVSNATSLDRFDRYQAKDTIWTISLRIMTIVCQENGRGGLRRIEHGIVTTNLEKLGNRYQMNGQKKSSRREANHICASNAVRSSVTVYIHKLGSYEQEDFYILSLFIHSSRPSTAMTCELLGPGLPKQSFSRK